MRVNLSSGWNGTLFLVNMHILHINDLSHLSKKLVWAITDYRAYSVYSDNLLFERMSRPNKNGLSRAGFRDEHLQTP